MATFSRLTSISIEDTVTAQTLHDLIEQCDVVGATLGDCEGAAMYSIAAQTATPNPSLSPFWYRTGDPWDRTFKVFAAPWNIWVTIGPDRLEIPMTNAAATDALQGAFVIAAGASLFSMATAPSLNALGFVQDDTPVGSVGAVCYYGIGWALYASATSGAIDDDKWGLFIDPGKPNHYGPLGTCHGYEPPNYDLPTAASNVYWGIFFAYAHTGYTQSWTPLLAYIYGPRSPLPPESS